jgi:predicted nucleic acid-binding protein
VIFVDTTFWVGDADANDDFHESAHTVIEAVRTGRLSPALTTDFVLDETVTILGRRGGFGADKASRVAGSVLASPRVFTVYVDEPLLAESLHLYPDFKGKLSLTDVASVVTMRRYGVRDIFSHDRDFEGVAGLKRLEAPPKR